MLQQKIQFFLVEEEEERENPTTNGGMQHGNSVAIRTRCMHVSARTEAISHAQSVLIDEISASELRRKFVRSALLVGLRGAC